MPSLVGGDLGEGDLQWNCGALATDGAIYCIPHAAKQILTIDPFKEFSATLQTNITLYPDEIGRLFLKDEEECDETFFERSLRKFGGVKYLKLLKNASPWMRNGLARIMANLPHSWWQLRVRIVQRL